MKFINRLLMTDSYKTGQFQQVPPKTTFMSSYFEGRGSERGYDETTLFSLQYFFKQYWSDPVTVEEVEEARELAEDANEPFNYDGWMLMVERHGGYFPVRVRAIPEGMIVPMKVALFTVESTDPDFYWLPDWVETAFCRAGWYGGTVIIQDLYIYRDIYQALVETSDDPDAEIPFKLHDFGARGASSSETAQIGGAAHLAIFGGSDTLEGSWLIKHFYNEWKGIRKSIPASQHSTISSWGRKGEVDAYRNMLNLYKGNGIFACVSDTWSIYAACDKLWGGELRQEVIDSGALVVIRPDSGDPVTVLCGMDEEDYMEEDGKYYRRAGHNYESHFYIPEKGNELDAAVVKGVFGILEERFGVTVNSKGYKVLNYVRVIQGDGINPTSIKRILQALKELGFSATNIAFGMGGALLQKVDRDVNKMAYKCSSITVDGEQRDVYKDPITDHGKSSKRGRLDTIQVLGFAPATIKLRDDQLAHPNSIMRTVYEDGKLLVDDNFSQIRERALTKSSAHATLNA
jgi:nicotinamide phosphoribosyltransferase